MRALKFNGCWNLQLEQVSELHSEQPHEVVVEVDYCGICGTDVGIVTGSYAVAVTGTTLGHEATGRIVEKGSAVDHLEIGDRVVINPTYACGACRHCRIGWPNHCTRKFGTEAGVSYDGAFADRYRTLADYVIKLDDHVDSRHATLTEPLSCTVTGVDNLHLTSTELRSLVIGAGPMGILYTWALHLRGLRPILIERSAPRREFARQAIPAGTPLHEDVDTAIQHEFGFNENQIDIAVDTSGKLAQQLFERLAPGGKLMNVALKTQTAALDILKIADKSLHVLGSIDSLNASFERSYHYIRDGKIPAAHIISHILPLEDYVEGFATIGCHLGKQQFSLPATPSAKVLLDLTATRSPTCRH